MYLYTNRVIQETHQEMSFLGSFFTAGRGGLVVGRPTAVREDPGSNLTAAGRVYHDSHRDIQPWARVVHPYCSA